MRSLLSIFAVVLALFSFAYSTSAQSFPRDRKASEKLQNWGFILSERKNLINGENYIGYGGFKDEASCEAEAEKSLAKLPDSSKFQFLCFSPFQTLKPQNLTPYKVAE